VTTFKHKLTQKKQPKKKAEKARKKLPFITVKLMINYAHAEYFTR